MEDKHKEQSPRIITEGYYEGETILLDEVTCTYIQESDCTECSDEPQAITLSTRDGGGGKFIHIKTQGWSINDDMDNLKVLINDFKKRYSDFNGGS